MLLAGCQVIPENEQLIPVGNQEPKSRALITEFTGFLCVNCPNAAAMAHDLLGLYPDNLIVVEMHPKANSFCQTTIAEYDYTCPAADSIYKALGGTAATSFPTGVVNLTSGLQDYTAWPSLVSTAVLKEARANISLDAELLTGRTVQVNYTAEIQPSETFGKVHLMLLLVEDNIVGPQMMPDGSTNMTYTHNHVLRGTLTDNVWGVEIDTTLGIKQLSYEVPEMNNGQTINLDNCSVVGVLTSNGEVLDVKQVKIK